jgi:apolipoprotein D and lipocalin family protein
MAKKDLDVVAQVDLQRYTGKWYEIARLPNRFQKGCVDTTATYTLLKDGSIEVLNECARGTIVDRIKGKAKVADKVSGAKLKVTFFWPFYAPYWIIGLDKDYEWAVVGTPNRKYLWLLSRSPKMEEKLYQSILQDIQSKGFDLRTLIKSVHTETL